MKIHVLASRPHYLRHVHAVWRHLPEDMKGIVRQGRQARKARTRDFERDDVVMVGSHADAELVAVNPVVYVEHGAGQSYPGDPHSRGHPSYHGSRHRGHVAAYIAPRQDVADSWNAPAFAAGCPALDGLVRDPGPLAVFTWHWDAVQVCAEARTARRHYERDLPAMIDHVKRAGFSVAATGHPKDDPAAGRWDDLGVAFLTDPDLIVKTASLVIADNTSLMYEAALADIPVLALNAPWYRRHVEHGLRFWQYVPGLQIGSPQAFMDLDIASYVHDDHSVVYRRSAAAYAYGSNPGGEAAARWLIDTLAEM